MSVRAVKGGLKKWEKNSSHFGNVETPGFVHRAATANQELEEVPAYTLGFFVLSAQAVASAPSDRAHLAHPEYRELAAEEWSSSRKRRRRILLNACWIFDARCT